MTRSLASAVLLCALTSPCAAARKKQPPAPPPVDPQRLQIIQDVSRRLEEIQRELEQLIEEMDPLVKQVEYRRHLMNEQRDLDELFAARDAQLLQVRSRLDRLSTLYDEYNALREQHDREKISIGVRAFLAGGVAPQDAGKDINIAIRRGQFGSQVRSFKDQTLAILRAEESAYMAARSTQRFRRRLLVATFCFLGAFLTAAFFVLRRRSPGGWAPPGTAPAIGMDPRGNADGTSPLAVVLGGNYKVERELGRGGMGLVYEATDLSLRRKVAIKRMREELYQVASDMEVFLREAQLVAALKHPNIVEIYSIFREKGRIYLVFEFVAGRSLQQVIAQGRRVSLRSTKRVLKQAGSALDYAHARKIIHRDLKPSNIMINQEGAVKVMDFGIAHQVRMTAAKMTQAEALGTPPYMAPEQELGTVSRESDLYALGVCFYEMLTGRLPFQGPNYLAQKQGMLFVPPSSLVSDLPSGVDSIVRRALEADPAKRFHSASELLAALETLPDVHTKTA